MTLVRIFFVLFATILLALAALALLQAGVFYWAYTWVLAHVVESTGLDVWASRAVTLAILAFGLLLPWHLLVLPLVGDARRRLAFFLIITALALAAIDIATRDVYFSRSDGHPLRYYIQTLDGYKFAAAPGTDPVYGVPYQPITAEAAQHYILWKARSGQMQDPAVPEGQYFNPSTGEPLRWYARLPNATLEFFTLPGFHPTYGMKLQPATAEVVAAYEKQRAEAERQRQEENDKQKLRNTEEAKRRAKAEAIRKARAEHRRKIIEEVLAKKPLRPGRYLFPDPRPSATIGGLQFALTEVDLAAERMLVHLEVANAGVDPKTELPPRSIRLALVSQEGTVIGYTAIRAKEGAVTDQSAGICYPPVGKRGAFVMEFPRDALQSAFSLVVNDQPLVSGVNLRRLAFQPF